MVRDRSAFPPGIIDPLDRQCGGSNGAMSTTRLCLCLQGGLMA